MCKWVNELISFSLCTREETKIEKQNFCFHRLIVGYPWLIVIKKINRLAALISTDGKLFWSATVTQSLLTSVCFIYMYLIVFLSCHKSGCFWGRSVFKWVRVLPQVIVGKTSNGDEEEATKQDMLSLLNQHIVTLSFPPYSPIQQQMTTAAWVSTRPTDIVTLSFPPFSPVQQQMTTAAWVSTRPTDIVTLSFPPFSPVQQQMTTAAWVSTQPTDIVTLSFPPFSPIQQQMTTAAWVSTQPTDIVTLSFPPFSPVQQQMTTAAWVSTQPTDIVTLSFPPFSPVQQQMTTAAWVSTQPTDIVTLSFPPFSPVQQQMTTAAWVSTRSTDSRRTTQGNWRLYSWHWELATLCGDPSMLGDTWVADREIHG